MESPGNPGRFTFGDIVINGSELGDNPAAHGKAVAASLKAQLVAELSKSVLSFGG